MRLFSFAKIKGLRYAKESNFNVIVLCILQKIIRRYLA